MHPDKIARINHLAKKRREQGLTEGEQAERAALHREYADSVKASLSAQLDSTVIRHEDGHEEPLRKKED